MADNLASDLELGRAAFLKFLADGPKRCPKLYGGMEKAMIQGKGLQSAVLGPSDPIVEPSKRVDFKIMASGVEEDEVLETPEDEPPF